MAKLTTLSFDCELDGIQYDETTARRAWASLVDLLGETFDR
jgi:hypothetical protein